MKTKIEELDIVRAFAIIGVLLIHGTSQATVDLELKSTTHSLFLIINRFSLFAVPVFVFVSSLVLFYRYSDDWNGRQAASFYRKRLKFIVIPYLIWSVLYYLYYKTANYIAGAPFQLDASEFARKLLWGESGPHLYFFILIFQFYVLFPLLMPLAVSLRRRPYLFAAICIAVNIAFYMFTYWYTPKYGPIPHRASYILGYMGLVGIGAAIGMHYARIASWLDRVKLGIIPLMAISGALLTYCYFLSYWGIGRPKTSIYDLLFHLHALFSALAFIVVGRWLLIKKSFPARFLSALGQASFGIYLIHVCILSVLRKTIDTPGTTIGYSLYTVGLIIVATAVPWLVVMLLRKWKHHWILLGR